MATLSGVALPAALSPAGTYSAVVVASPSNNVDDYDKGSGNLVVAKADQAVTFAALAGKTYGDAAFAVSATASSGLVVSFAASGNCSLAGTTVTITGAGGCTVTASQSGNANFNAAPNVSQPVTIAKANQTVTFGALPNATYGDAPFALSATASSGLAVSLAATGNCTLSTNSLTISGAGKSQRYRLTGRQQQLQRRAQPGAELHHRQREPDHHLPGALRQNLWRFGLHHQRQRHVCAARNPHLHRQLQRIRRYSHHQLCRRLHSHSGAGR